MKLDLSVLEPELRNAVLDIVSLVRDAGGRALMVGGSIAKRDRLLNAGADINGYEPVTFDELVENNRRFKDAHPDCQPHAYPCVKE